MKQYRNAHGLTSIQVVIVIFVVVLVVVIGRSLTSKKAKPGPDIATPTNVASPATTAAPTPAPPTPMNDSPTSPTLSPPTRPANEASTLPAPITNPEAMRARPTPPGARLSAREAMTKTIRDLNLSPEQAQALLQAEEKMTKDGLETILEVQKMNLPPEQALDAIQERIKVMTSEHRQWMLQNFGEKVSQTYFKNLTGIDAARTPQPRQ